MPSKRHATLWCALATTFGVNPKTLSRASRENASFFHVTLPTLGKDIDRGLSGTFVLTAPLKKQRNTALPSFLYEFLILCFHKNGDLRIDAYEKLRELRQLCMMFYKFEVPFSDDEIRRGTEKFIETDLRVKNSAFPYGIAEIRKRFISLLPSSPWDIRGHHASGATADRYNNAQKREVRRFIPSLMKTYDPRYFFNSEAHAIAWTSHYATVTAEPSARLAFVPKDSRGPRVICMEPHERMFIQKGLQTLLYDYIEQCSPARGYINFSNQDINRSLAYKGSIDGSYATIDLKDASDLVSWELIRLLLPPDWYRALRATRSECVELPDGRVITINKYASMGSALCFPIEAMLFWVIARSVAPEVYVYGDDIIVHQLYAEQVIKALESYGLIVNKDKTLLTGRFRESCGSEFFNGRDISYSKVKSYDFLPYIAFCNELTKKFGLASSRAALQFFELEFSTQVFRQPVEYSDLPSPGVYYTTESLASNDVFFKRRYNVHLQRYEYRRLVPKEITKPHKYKTDYDPLFDWLTSKTSITPSQDEFWSNILSDLPVEATYRVTNKIVTVCGESPLGNHGEVSLRTKLKYTWV